MQKSESITALIKGLITFHNCVDNVTKNAQNPFFKSSYTTLDNIINTIEPAMNAAGLTFSQFPTGEHGLTTILMHDSGEWMQSEYFMMPVKNDPQGTGSAITYQRRYALAAILGLSVDTDDDANHATHGGSSPQAAQENNMAWLNVDSKEFAGAVKKIAAGTSSIPALRKYFKISKETEKALLSASEKPEKEAVVS